MYENTSFNIKTWAEEDRPREKLMLRGKHNLSDAELIAILIGSGSRNETAVALAQRILKAAGNNLHELGKKTIHELTQFKGIGDAKAIAIAAAMELGRRREHIGPSQKPLIVSSNDAYRVLAGQLRDLPHEEFWVLLLNRANRLLHKERISVGGIEGTVADSRLIFKLAVEKLASAIILCHNHPSGNLRPSENDLKITKKIKTGAKLLDLKIMDHLIISEYGYFSFADEGILA